VRLTSVTPTLAYGGGAPAAAIASHSPDSLAASSALQLFFSLLVVLVLIFALTWLAKRLRVAGPRASRNMAVLDELCVGPKERILLVRVGTEQLLLGIAANSVIALSPLDRPIALTLPDAGPSFAERLREYLRTGGRAQ
jgi:flagellar protein FliO/FliZ